MPSMSSWKGSLDDLTDVDTTTTAPADGDTLVYDATSGLWLPGAPSGGAAEHFRYIIDFTTTATTATSETVSLSSGASGAFASAGVSLSSDVITLPVGKWLLGLTVEATYWSAQPTFGDYHMGFDVTSPPHPYVASLDFEEYGWTGSAPTFSGSNLYDITVSDQTIKVWHYTDSGETSYLYGMVWGVQIA